MTNDEVKGRFGTRFYEAEAGVMQAGRQLAGSFVHSPRIIIMPIVGGAARHVVELGNVVGIEATFYDDAGAVFSPQNNAAEIYIRNPSGTVVQNYVSMSVRGVGTFVYQFQIADTDPVGTWLVRVRGQMDTGEYLKNSMRFQTALVE